MAAQNQDVKVAVILNGVSFHKKKFYKHILPRLSAVYPTEVFETKSKNDAKILARNAALSNYNIILAAGGDGTIHQVINGILNERDHDLPAVGIIPLGTGNDFARGIGLLYEPEDHLINLLKKFSPKLIDVGEVYYSNDKGLKDQSSYFINEASIGMGPEVVSRVMNSQRRLGAAIEYYKNILLTFFHYRPMFVTAVSPDWEWRGKMRSLALANGKYFGHGLCIAPRSKPDDGIFNAFICGNVSVFDFIRYSETLKNARIVKHPEVHYHETKSIMVNSETKCLIEADGELLGELPATIEMASVKIPFLY
jgi:diacylglycerol kinase (ATP)